MRNKTIASTALLLACVATSAIAVDAARPTRVFVGELTGPDTFINSRAQMVFLEKLGEFKSVVVVTSEAEAEFLLSGAIRVEKDEASSIGAVANEEKATASGSAGIRETALISAKLLDAQGRLAFVTSISWVRSTGDTRDATEEAVIDVIERMQKRLGWKR